MTVIYLTVFYIPDALQGLAAKIGLVISIAACVVVAFSFKRCKSTELCLLIAYGGWYVFVRLMHGDIYDSQSLLSAFNISCVSVFCFALGKLLRPDERGKLLDWLCFLSCGLLFVYAVLGTYTAITNTPLLFVSRLATYATHIRDEGALRYVLFFDLHKNVSAAWFLIGLCLMIYQFFACKRKLWRLPIAFAGLLFYITISLQHCRNIVIAAAVCLTMLAMLLVYLRVKSKHLVATAVCLVLTAAICLPVFYYGQSASAQMISKIAYSAASRSITSTSTSSDLMETAETPDAADASPTGEIAYDDNTSMLDPRGLDDLGSFGERTGIWAAIFPAIKEQPGIALIGAPLGTAMDVVNRHIVYEENKPHMHNMFLQTLLTTGITGLLLSLAFCLLLLIKMIKCFFSRSEKLTLAQRTLVLLMAGLFIYSMLEPAMFTLATFYTTCFYITAGIFLGNYTDAIEE